MKKVLFGIFAHPDDEAFGPSGTLLHMVRDGIDLHLICATDGAAGVNCDEAEDLGALRSKEWQAAGAAFGAKTMLQLGFIDGELNNNQFHALAESIEARVRDTCKAYDAPFEVSFMTFDSTGLSGHIDHIVVSMAVNFVFCRLKADTKLRVVDIWQFCLSREVQPEPDTSFVFMPPGRPASDISHTEDVRDVLDKKIAIMRLHHSQRGDAEAILRHHGDAIGDECFVICS